MKKIFAGIASTSLLIMPLAVVAAIDPGDAIPVTEVAVYDTINAVINWAFAILVLFAAVMIIMAAYIFLTSAGDPEKTGKARNYIVYALVAIVVGFLAKAIIVLVGNMLGITTGLF